MTHMIENSATLRWGSISPLIGGESIGASMAAGNKPAFMMSYPEFAGNESSIRQYWPDVPFITLGNDDRPADDDSARMFEDARSSQVDFVNAVCPCAGLSMFNSSKTRGSDAPQNQYMFRTAELVLETMRPKVFWGENAPALASNTGAGALGRLIEIARRHEYSFSVVKTSTVLHGLPQNRRRTFYFFWKSPKAPIMGYHRTQPKPLAKYLKEIPETATLRDVQFAGRDLASEPLWVWARSQGVTREMITAERTPFTLLGYLHCKGLVPAAIQHFEKTGTEPKLLKFLKHVMFKTAQNKGWWDGSPIFLGDTMTTIYARTMAGAVHPTEERFMSMREHMHLMGLPHDFDLAPEAGYNSVAQNVPTLTARDWASEVVRFCRDELPLSDHRLLRQDNFHQRAEPINIRSVPVLDTGASCACA